MNSNKITTLVIGLLLIAISFIILIGLLAKLDATSQILDYWPAVLIFIGVLAMSGKNTSSYGVALGLIFLGIFGALRRIGAMQTPTGQALVALFVGFGGIVMLVMLVSRPKKSTSNQPINRSDR